MRPSALLPLSTLLAAALRAAPVIHCEAPHYDFGEQPVERAVRHVFVIENRGDEDLVVSEIRPGCASCTTAGLQPNRLPPGAKGELSVQLQLMGFRGPLRKAVVLRSNDPARPNFEVSLRGTAVTEILLTPDLLSFAQIPVDTVVSGRVEVACTSTNLMRVTKAVSDNPAISATVAPIEDGRRYELQVTVRGVPSKPDPARGGAANKMVEGTVVIFLDHPTQEAVPLSVRGFIRDRLYVVPGLIPLVPDSPPGAVRQLMLQHEPLPGFKVTAVEWPEGGVEFDWSPLGAGRGRLTLRNFSTDPALNGREVVIRTTMPGREVVRVPIRMLGAPAPATPTPP